MFWDRDEQEVHRVFKLSSGGEVHFRAVPPYGLWKVAWGKGELPESLSGLYRSFTSARTAVENYLKSRSKNKARILEEIPIDGS